MRGRDTEKIREELRELILKQTEALRAQTFGGLTDKEAREYDRRQKEFTNYVRAWRSLWKRSRNRMKGK